MCFNSVFIIEPGFQANEGVKANPSVNDILGFFNFIVEIVCNL
jgi:hypothetical protein